MITQELVTFIKQQLQEGNSKEQIANILTPHGWELSDINMVFSQIMPSTTPVSVTPPPMVQAPIVQNSTLEYRSPVMNQGYQSSEMVQPQGTPSGFLAFLKNPSTLVAILITVFSSALGTLIFMLTQKFVQNSSGVYFLGINFFSKAGLILGMFVLIILGNVLGAAVTKLVTKILSLEPRSYTKALAFTASLNLIIILLQVLGALGGPLFSVVAFIVMLILWVVYFWFYYETSIGKSIVAFLLNGFIQFLGTLLIVIVSGAFISKNSTFFMKKITPVTELVPPAQEVIQETPRLQLQQPITNTIQNDNSATQNNAIITPNIVTNSNTSSSNELPVVSNTITSTPVTTSNSITNPEFSHVKDAFPVKFPLPTDQEVISAVVLSATDFESIRYVLDYTTTHSMAYMRNAIKSSLTNAGYVISLNDSNADYQIITASKVVRTTARTFKIILEKTSVNITVHTIFTQ